jgi:hypothetical protein
MGEPKGEVTCPSNTANYCGAEGDPTVAVPEIPTEKITWGSRNKEVRQPSEGTQQEVFRQLQE